MRFTLIAALALIGACGAPLSTLANEIQYGFIREVAEDEMAIEFRSPGGSEYFHCNTKGSCRQYDELPQLLPAIAGSTDYPHNPQGTYGVRILPWGEMTLHILYDLTERPAQPLGYLPVREAMERIRFSPDGRSILFFDGNSVRRFDLRTNQMTEPLYLDRNLPFLSISPGGRYVSAYSYANPGHRIWDLDQGRDYTIPAEEPSYVEFSQDETRAAYADVYQDYRTLFETTLSDLPTIETTRLTVGDVAEDYLYAGNVLFYLANTDSPYDWSLWARTARGEETRIEQNASYGDFLRRVDGHLSYLKIEGKTSLPVLIDPDDLADEDERVALAPVGITPAETDITREVVSVAGRSGVLLSPERDNRNSDTLFIWLHGGPQRQTSLGYHPYLSYAVYDELLERLAGSGYHVLKLDYTGSWGYSKSFLTALHGNIGVVDVADIENAIEHYEDELDIEATYLIGNSYGGYLALKGIAELADQVAGAISINGVSNWYSLTSRIPSSPFTKLFEGVPDTHNLATYRRAEVFSGLVEDVDDQPILIAYSEEDSSVPVWQSTEYLDFARAHGKNVTELALPGEDHVIKRRDSLTALCEAISATVDVSRMACDR
ncbi:alpha/beta fold hydrolase [Patescibacteria group bacterium]|jgi:dipeptidyl aminopeptidase/acylaminoacyl peptidase|nr:alpha/beta fold hydrolase [Patescibacteria group bacterium]